MITAKDDYEWTAQRAKEAAKYEAFKQHAKEIARYLKGRVVHVSTEIVSRPLLAAQHVIDDWAMRVQAGQIRDVCQLAMRNGDLHLLGRTKGKTYLHKSKQAYPAAKRASRREAARITGTPWSNGA